MKSLLPVLVLGLFFAIPQSYAVLNCTKDFERLHPGSDLYRVVDQWVKHDSGLSRRGLRVAEGLLSSQVIQVCFHPNQGDQILTIRSNARVQNRRGLVQFISCTSEVMREGLGTRAWDHWIPVKNSCRVVRAPSTPREGSSASGQGSGGSRYPGGPDDRTDPDAPHRPGSGGGPDSTDDGSEGTDLPEFPDV